MFEDILECIEIERMIGLQKQQKYALLLPQKTEQFLKMEKEYVKNGLIRFIDQSVDDREKWDEFMKTWRDEVQPFLNQKLGHPDLANEAIDEAITESRTASLIPCERCGQKEGTTVVVRKRYCQVVGPVLCNNCWKETLKEIKRAGRKPKDDKGID